MSERPHKFSDLSGAIFRKKSYLRISRSEIASLIEKRHFQLMANKPSDDRDRKPPLTRLNNCLAIQKRFKRQMLSL